MLKIDKKERENIKKMYKDNPVLQFLTQTIFEDEIKKYQELLKQKKLEAKQKELEVKQKEELLKQKEIEAKQKELEAKQKELEKEREIIELLLKFKVKEKINEIILKIQKIEDISKLNKIRKILELELNKDEYLNQIKEFFDN